MVAVFLCAITAGAQTTATPVFTLPAGTYSMPQSTTITDSTAGAVILWCYNVSSSCTPATSYSGSIYINPPSTVELCSNATASGHPQSATACALYTNGGASGTTATPPTASPAAGSYTAAQTVSLTTTNLCAHMLLFRVRAGLLHHGRLDAGLHFDGFCRRFESYLSNCEYDHQRYRRRGEFDHRRLGIDALRIKLAGRMEATRLLWQSLVEHHCLQQRRRG